jgi:valyl-tRNA synthetase
VWNASRYILMNLDGRNYIKNAALLPVDKWIYSRLACAGKTIHAALLSYRYNEAANTAYEYFWNDFCDWYVEATKLSTKLDDDAEKDRAVSVLLDVLTNSLLMLHPFLPFVTEEIYSKMPSEVKTDGMLITQKFPEFDNADTAAIEKNFSLLQEIVRSIRTLRSECTITNDKKIRIKLNVSKDYLQFVNDNAELITMFAGLSEAQTGIMEQGSVGEQGWVALAGSSFEAFVFIAETADVAALKTKWQAGIEKDKKYIKQLEAKLANSDFISNAPVELVEAEKLKLQETAERIRKIETYLGHI